MTTSLLSFAAVNTLELYVYLGGIRNFDNLWALGCPMRHWIFQCIPSRSRASTMSPSGDEMLLCDFELLQFFSASFARDQSTSSINDYLAVEWVTLMKYKHWLELGSRESNKMLLEYPS